MSDRRRAEIEAKRAKLAELRKARADRQKADNERRLTEVRFLCPRAVHPNTPDSRQSTGPSPHRKDVEDLVNLLVGGSSSSRGLGQDSADLTPLSSIPGTPSGHNTGLPGPSGLSVSGRASRQSDVFSDRVSPGTTLAQSTNSGTDHVIDRYVPLCDTRYTSV